MTKNLRFDNRFETDETLVNDLTLPCGSVSVFDQMQLSENDNYITLKLSSQQFTDIYSALQIGARINEPQNYQNILLYFLQGVMCPMNLCDAIELNCMTDADFMSALVAALLPYGIGGNGSGNDTPLDSENTSDISGLSAGCTASDEYGVCYELVAKMDTIATDFFEIVETITNPGEYAATLSDNIPIFQIVGGSVVETAAWLQDTIAEIYAAAFNASSHEDMACALYCEIKGTCDITLENIRDAYRSFLGGLSIPSPATDWVTFTLWMAGITTGLTDNVTVSLMHLFIAEVMVRGSRFLGAVTRSLEIAAQYAVPLLPPASCGCAGEWCWTADFTSTNGGFTTSVPNRNQGEYVGSTGWQCEYGVPDPNPDAVGNDARCYIQLDFDDGEATVGLVDIHYDSTDWTGGSSRNFTVRLMDNGGTTPVDTISDPNYPKVASNELIQVDFGGQTGDAIRIQITQDANGNPGSDLVTMIDFTMSGDGDNPMTGGDNC